MGTPWKRAALLRRGTPGVLVAMSLLLVGCPTDRNPREVTSEEFITPRSESMRVLTSRLDLLRAIKPDVLDNPLDQDQTRPIPLGKTSEDRLVIWESQQTAIVSVDLCPECSESDGRTSSVMLHWSQDGLDRELDEQGVVTLDPVISFDNVGDATRPGVTPIVLRGATFNGWLLAIEGISGSLIAFREEAGFRPLRPDQFPTNPTEDPNFGGGRGLLMAVVATGQDIQFQTGEGDARVSRIVEIDDGKVLLFFTTVSSIHLLELELTDRDVVWDRMTGETRTVQVPTGTVRFFDPDPALSETGPQPFLTYDRIQDEVTSDIDIDLDAFQPLYLAPSGVDTCASGTLPSGGGAIVFDTGSGTILRIDQGAATRPGGGENPRAGRGEPSAVVTASQLAAVTGPEAFAFQGAYGPGCESVLIFEESSNNLVQLDLDATDASSKLSVPAETVDFLLRRFPVVIQGDDIVPSSDEPIMRAAEDNITENRFYFDQGQDQLVSVHIESGNVVVVVDRPEFEAITGFPQANVTYIESLEAGDPNQEYIRLWDTQSGSLIHLETRYIPLPVRDQERD